MPRLPKLVASLLLATLLPGSAGAHPVPDTLIRAGQRAAEAALDAPATPEGRLAAGREALGDRAADRAAVLLQGCVSQDPQAVDCWWELGWAHYLGRRWSQVVAAWEEVARRAPDHPEVGRYLAIAREQQRLDRRLRAARWTAPVARRGATSARLTLRAVGDVMLGTDFPAGHLPPEDGATLLEPVRPLLESADLTFINLEGPLCDGGETTKCRPGQNCYAFRSPTRYGRYLAEAGVDLASTANNHSGDFGEVCRRETEATLDTLGIAWSGPPGSIGTVEAQGLRVALVAFHVSPATNWLLDQPGAEALVAAAAAAHDLVIVSFHGGAEGRNALHLPDGPETFYGEDRGDLRRFARGVVDAGADLVLGHGPHVVRGMEVWRGRLIAYSLGNFATYGRFNLSGPLGLGVVLEAELDGTGRFLGGRLFATRQVGAGMPEPDPSGAAVDLIRILSSEDLPGTGVVVARDGTLLPPAASAPQAAATPDEETR